MKNVGSPLDTAAYFKLNRTNWLPEMTDILFVKGVKLQLAQDQYGTNIETIATVDSGEEEYEITDVFGFGVRDVSHVRPVSPSGYGVVTHDQFYPTGERWDPHIFLSLISNDVVPADPKGLSAPIAVRIYDRDFDAQNVRFLDEDLRTGYILGSLSWDPYVKNPLVDSADMVVIYDVFVGSFNRDQKLEYVGSTQPVSRTEEIAYVQEGSNAELIETHNYNVSANEFQIPYTTKLT